jgi:hypothetical protein
LVGCTVNSNPTPAPATLAPGATSQFDSDTFRALATAHAFATQAASNPAVLTPTQKVVLNQFIVDLNAADVLYASYHAGVATQAAMQASLTTVTSDQAKFATAGVQ